MTSYSRILISPKSLSSFPSGVALSKCCAKILESLTEAYFWGFLYNNYLIPSKSSVLKISYPQQRKNMSSPAIGWQAIPQTVKGEFWFPTDLVVGSNLPSKVQYSLSYSIRVQASPAEFAIYFCNSHQSLYPVVTGYSICYSLQISRFSRRLFCFSSRIMHHYIASSNV